MALVGLFQLFHRHRRGPHAADSVRAQLPLPVLAWPDGTMWLAGGFLVLNLLILLEVADRLTLKKDLEVAREIQQAMLPREIYTATGIEAFGVTRPANTVGGDFYDVLRRPDGRIVFALGDVAGKGSPAALLMALAARDAARAGRRRPRPADAGRAAQHAGQPARARRRASSRWSSACTTGDRRDRLRQRGPESADAAPRLGTLERLTEGGIALGMFDQADLHGRAR